MALEFVPSIDIRKSLGLSEAYTAVGVNLYILTL